MTLTSDERPLWRRRAEIDAMMEEIERCTKALAAKGIDAREPEDREAFDTVCRIERQVLANRGKAA